MKKTSILTKSIAAAALVVFAASAFAKTKSSMPLQHQPKQKMQRMVKQNPGYAKLTTSQKDAIKNIAKNYREHVTPIRKQSHAKSLLLEAELAQQNINEDKVHELVKDVSALQNQLFAARIEAMVQIHKATGLPVPLPKRR